MPVTLEAIAESHGESFCHAPPGNAAHARAHGGALTEGRPGQITQDRPQQRWQPLQVQWCTSCHPTAGIAN
jgi:hypothetical protein